MKIWFITLSSENSNMETIMSCVMCFIVFHVGICPKNLESKNPDYLNTLNTRTMLILSRNRTGWKKYFKLKKYWTRTGRGWKKKFC